MQQSVQYDPASDTPGRRRDPGRKEDELTPASCRTPSALARAQADQPQPIRPFSLFSFDCFTTDDRPTETAYI